MSAFALFASVCVELLISAVPSSLLVRDLAHDDFAVREATTAELARRWPQSATVLYGAAASADPEVARRATAAVRWGRRLTDPFLCAAKRVDAAFPTIMHFPFIDSLWYDVSAHSYSTVRPPFEDACRNAYRPYVDDHRCALDPCDKRPYLMYRAATRRLAVEWVRDFSCPIWALRLLFGAMAWRDRAYLYKHSLLSVTSPVSL